MATILPRCTCLPCREDARFLYKRTPDAVKAGRPELQAAFALLQRVWTKDYRAVWAALQVRWLSWVGSWAACV